MLRVAVGTVHGLPTDAALMAISIPKQVFVLKPLNPVRTDSDQLVLMWRGEVALAAVTPRRRDSQA